MLNVIFVALSEHPYAERAQVKFFLCAHIIVCLLAGVNGRPGKRSDVCYAWWVGATCAIVERLDVIDRDALIQSVLAHQHEAGGIAAHRGDRPDLFHTHFGIAALGVLGHPRIPPVDPVLCLPATTLGKITHCHQDS